MAIMAPFKFLVAAMAIGSWLPSSNAFPAVTMEVYPAAAPNIFASPSFDGWTVNALDGLENGLPAIGTPGATPTAYYRVSTLGDGGNIVSSFNSWQGVLSPGSVFGPAFANEGGNRLHFGLHVLGNGMQFRLSNLSFAMHSSDVGNILGYVDDFSTLADTYAPYRVGIDYGADRIKSTADDVMITSGPATQLVDELAYVGAGNALDPASTGCSGTDQSVLNCIKTVYDHLSPLTVTTMYTLKSDSNSPIAIVGASVTIQSLGTSPVPALGLRGLAFLGLGFVFLGMVRRRKPI